MCKSGVTLSNNNLVATNPKSYYHSVLGDSQVKKFKIKILSRGDVLVGFACKSTFNEKRDVSDIQGNCMLGCLSGTIWPGCVKYMGVSVDSIVECVYDEIGGTVSFVIDGVDKGVAKRGITGDMYPAVVLNSPASVEIVN